MKKIKQILLLTNLVIGSIAFAQAPEKMSYQAVVRNTTNNLVVNQAVGMQISILQGSSTGTAVYVETQTPTTNTNGLVSIEIGSGAVVSGNMTTINWANGPYFIKTETDPTGGTSYTISGTSQLLSSPYALYAKTSGSSTPGPQGPQGPQGPTGLIASGSIAGNTPYWNGSSWVTNSSNIFNNGGNVGIGTSSPNAAAKLDISSTTQVFLPPRMTTAQRNAISNTPAGGMIFNTSENKLQVYKAALPAPVDGTGNSGTWALYDGPAQGQVIQPLSSGALTSIQAQVAIRVSSGDIVCKIYNAPNGTLLATSTNTINAPWAGSEFNFVTGLWSFSGFSFVAGTNYYVEFTATNGNRFFIGMANNTYPRGAHYTGLQGSTNVTDFDIDMIVNYGVSVPAAWENLH